MIMARQLEIHHAKYMVNQRLKLSANQCESCESMRINRISAKLHHFANFRMHMSGSHDNDVILQNNVTLH